MDVILVIDTRKMNEGSPKSALTYAKEVAINFADQALQTPQLVAVVTYDYQYGQSRSLQQTKLLAGRQPGTGQQDCQRFYQSFTGTNGINN